MANTNAREHDKTKNMLSTLRTLKNQGQSNYIQTGVIREGVYDKQDEIDMSSDEINALTGELKGFGVTVNVDVYKVYPKVGNVVFGGTITNMGNLEFQMTLEDGNRGFYITANNTLVIGDFSDLLGRLQKWYEGTFIDTAGEKLREYGRGY